MPAAPTPINDAERVAALHSYEVLDSACEDSFDTMARLAARLTGSPIALVSLVDDTRQWFKAAVGIDVREMPRDRAFCAHAILDPQTPLVVTDATTDGRFADNPLVTGRANIRFYAGVPLVNPEGFALGTLCVLDREPRDIDPDMLDTLAGLAQSVVNTLELRRAMLQLRSMALTDVLTGLANRSALLSALAKAIAVQGRQGRPFSLLYIDLDRFKEVNDLHGHASGDDVLKIVAEVLLASVRCEDTAARVGGDEFAIVLAECNERPLECVAARICTAISHRMMSAGWPTTASVGGVTFLQPPATSGDAVAAADTAMYAAKLAGRNRVHCRSFPERRAAAVATDIVWSRFAPSNGATPPSAYHAGE